MAIFQGIPLRSPTTNDIIESVDSISRDGQDVYIRVIQYKAPKISEQITLEVHNHNLQQN